MPYVLHAGRQFLRTMWKKGSRKGLRLLMLFSPEEKKLQAERWLRGREQCQKLRTADFVVVSFGKSGRTWLRVMTSRVYQQMHKLPERQIIGFDNFHAMNREIPRIFFTHDNYIKDYTGSVDSKAPFYGKKVVLLVRNPKDIAVSQYFQWQHRMRPAKKKLNNYPPHGADVSAYDFVMDPDCGLPDIIAFLNLWAREAGKVEDLLIVRYEDMRSDTKGTLNRVMEFINASPPDVEAVSGAVEYSSVENMRKLEEQNVFWLAGGRMKPGKKGDPNTYKVRRAKVGGYRDYFDAAEAAQIDEYVAKKLSPAFGYDAEGTDSAPSPGAEGRSVNG